MPQLLIGVVLVGHGLITSAIAFGTLSNPTAPAIAVPAFGWWPGALGRSWVFDGMHLGTGFGVLGGLLWLAAGIALVAGGVGWLGVGPLEAIRYPLLLAGAGIGLIALALYFHPVYLAAVAINVAIVAVVLGRLTSAV